MTWLLALTALLAFIVGFALGRWPAARNKIGHRKESRKALGNAIGAVDGFPLWGGDKS